MKKINCPCGKEFEINDWLIKRKKYCSKICFYKYRTRPSGLEYKIVKKNPTWFKKGKKPWIAGKKHKEETLKILSEIKKGKHSSIKTEFKYINGNGYRNLLYKGILKCFCKKCGEKNIKRLHIHHKDFNRKNNKINNLIVLCRPCHLKIHGKVERNYVEGRKKVKSSLHW